MIWILLICGQTKDRLTFAFPTFNLPASADCFRLLEASESTGIASELHRGINLQPENAAFGPDPLIRAESAFDIARIAPGKHPSTKESTYGQGKTKKRD